ncbi:uncharacterized protein LOC119690111 [Teleopsis dalmanni]|uniref:uncharacterized protein LOC119690111 n=1 Tax=Teleopsis dalmanni TaxID=139649 RepID=UPI0018CEF5BA|nr:uncharacterized protein LOC119690111 [Teleopsis dalmanni]XP_037961030.1 uncharacterized protein LOC119690111 [Teleopsis dalmanni]
MPQESENLIPDKKFDIKTVNEDNEALQQIAVNFIFGNFEEEPEEHVVPDRIEQRPAAIVEDIPNLSFEDATSGNLHDMNTPDAESSYQMINIQFRDNESIQEPWHTSNLEGNEIIEDDPDPDDYYF